MDQYEIIRRVRLQQHHQAPSLRRRNEIPQPPTISELIIEPREAGNSFELRYLDQSGNSVRSNKHESLALAMGQAEWDHSVAPVEWRASDRN